MRWLPWLGVVSVLAASSPAFAKSFGVRTPSGKVIYSEDETFEQVLDQDRRKFVVEAAVGAGPEGNLGLVFGWLLPMVKGLELYAGIGLEVNPSVHYTFTARYLMNFSGYRPYVAAGYLANHLYRTGTLSHNAFAEGGYSFKLRHTYHLTIGVGVRRLLHVNVLEDSPLLAASADPELLRASIDAIPRWLPTLSIRLSRAF